MAQNETRFEFGKNWDKFIEHSFSEERVNIALQHILGFIEKTNLEGCYFLDIGCGSGLHSLAAYRAGARKIVSFDYDVNSVNTTAKLRAHVGNPQNWEVFQGSILDGELLKSLEPADLVYSWGVLHHTGQMWKAMDNIVNLIKEDGQAYIALYDYDIQVDPSPEFWLKVKREYNRSAWFKRRIWELWYFVRFFLGKNPLNIFSFFIRREEHKFSRGMALYTDIVDWLGGWPMEFAKREDVKQWAVTHGLQITKTKMGEANTEYLFTRK
jgi:2-polyprenyl-6-hydroxyphenyl methylase/3-demethylubiquinone-9 3-methyltransferase